MRALYMAIEPRKHPGDPFVRSDGRGEHERLSCFCGIGHEYLLIRRARLMVHDRDGPAGNLPKKRKQLEQGKTVRHAAADVEDLSRHGV